MSRRALITGVAGQDGSLLSELLLDNGYRVFGIVRRSTSERYSNLEAVRGRIELLQPTCSISCHRPCAQTLRTARGLQPGVAFLRADVLASAAATDRRVAAIGATALLEAIRLVDPSIRFYQASSSEIFGEPLVAPQTEDTPISPLTPYGIAKAYAHFITRSYRRRYGLHASSGILYNHESPRRPHGLPSAQGRQWSGTDQARTSVENCCSAILMHDAIRASPATTSRRCGSCCSRRRPTTT